MEAARNALNLDRFGFAVEVRKHGITCSERDIERWENDRNMPEPDKCVAIARAANTTVEYLVTGDEPAEVQS